MIIAPEIIITPDLPTIRFREPREKIDLDLELQKILQSQGWGCGTYFNVQFISHDKTILLSCAQFVVTQVAEAIHTSEANPYQPITRTVFSRKSARTSDWWTQEGLEVKTIKAQSDGAKVTWNPGKKTHQVKNGDEVLYETPDKELANKVAAGEIPVPKAA